MMDVKKKIESVRSMTLKEKMILLAAGGVVILLLCIPTGNGKTETVSEINQTESAVQSSFEYLQEYTDYLEQRLRNLLTDVDGIGKMEIMITLETSEEYIKDDENKKTVMPKVLGVVISCEGGESAVIKEEIVDAVQALFSVDPHKIKVLKMK